MKDETKERIEEDTEQEVPRPASEKAGVQKSLPWVLLKVKSLVCRKSAPRMSRLVLVIMNF